MSSTCRPCSTWSTRSPGAWRCLWLRLETLRLPASQAAAAGSWVVGAVATGAAGVELEPGARYRSRFFLTGLAQFASKSRLVGEFEKLGFRQVQAWDEASKLPADWPPTERREANEGRTWWAEGVYQGAGKTFDAAQLEDKGVTFLWIAKVGPSAAPPAPVPPVTVPGQETPAQPPPAPPPAQSWAVPMSSAESWALNTVAQAFGQVHQRSPELSEGLFIAALCRLESNYGRAYGEAKNWGSVHAGKPPCGPGSVLWTDKDAQGNSYPICMKAYPSDVEGAADVVRLLTTRRPAVWKLIRERRPLEEIAAKLRAGETVNGKPVYGYFEASAPLYAKALRLNMAAILKATGLPDPFAPGASSSSEGGGGAAGIVALLLLGGALASRRR